jgi:hypothetical protein
VRVRNFHREIEPANVLQYYLKSNKSLLKKIKSAGKYKWAQEKENEGNKGNKGSGD